MQSGSGAQAEDECGSQSKDGSVDENKMGQSKEDGQEQVLL